MCDPHRKTLHASHRKIADMKQVVMERIGISSISTNKLSKKHDKQDKYITRINNMSR